jgi:hypothetical protein
MASMPQYFFNIRNHVKTDDYVGLDLANLAAAKVEALKDIADIMVSRSSALGNGWPHWSIEICDRKRKVLMVVPFSNN